MNLILYVPCTFDGRLAWEYASNELLFTRAFIKDNTSQYARIYEMYCHDERSFSVVLECPECGSDSIYDKEVWPPIHVCNECEHEWSDNDG